MDNIPLEGVFLLDVSAAFQRLIREGDSVLLGLSGGADSVALLHMLLDFREKRAFSLRALHVEHGIRGAEALGDADFVRGMCSALGVPLGICHVDVPGEAKRRRSGLEETARFLRHAALHEAANGARIALAHHADDQAESVLLHLARGSGLQGLLGMSEDEPPYIRPLLGLRASEIRDYLRARGIGWREDSTNADTAYARNRVRSRILPEIEVINPRAVEAIGRLSGILREQEDWLAGETGRAFAQAYEAMPYGARLRREDWPAALARRVLRHAVEVFRPGGLRDVEYGHIDALLRGRTTELPDGLRVLATRDYWCFLGGESPPRGRHALRIPGRTLCERGTLLLDTVATPSPKELRERPRGTDYLRPGALEGACLRYRENGDRFHRLGGGNKKLKDFLIDSHVEQPLRDYIPLIARGSTVLWVAGFGIAEECAARHAEDEALRLRYRPKETTNS